MRGLKNIRHERFVREYIKTGVASEAYRRVYPRVAPLNSTWASASRLLRQDKVQRRIKAIQGEAMKRSDITIEKILKDYQTALDLAHAARKPTEIVMAAKEQARLVGLLVERKELGGVGDFENMTDPADVLDKVRLELGEEAAAALGKAFGVTKAAVAGTTAQITTDLWPKPDDTIN